jgi:alkaline phosphatase D
MRCLRFALSVVFLLLAAATHLRADESPKVLERIAFGSCVHQDKPQPIWEAIVGVKPDLFLFAGDNIYGDTSDMDVLKKKYAKLGAQPGYQKLLKACPVLATWDDHDYGLNDAGLDYTRREESQQTFLDFFGVPKDSPRRKQKGIHHAVTFGPPDQRVQIILLDTRYHRSKLKKAAKTFAGKGPYVADTSDGVTMLGAEQWQWLEKQLQQPARLRLIVSSVQVIPEDHNWEKWMNFPAEREKLFKLIRDTKANGVVFLSGDRHLAELSLMDGGVGYPLYDLTSSGLNQADKKWRPQEVNKHRVATMNFGQNFGTVFIDWSQPDPIVSLQIRDEAGDIVHQQKVPLSVLQPGVLPARDEQRAKLASGELLTAAAIKKHLDQKCTVVFKVRNTGTSSGSKLFFLNSATDRFHDENFTVVVQPEAQKKIKEGGVTDLRKHFLNQTVQVSGTLSLYQDRPQIIVTDPAQVQVLTKKD